MISEHTETDSDRQQIQKLTQQWEHLWSPKTKLFTGKGFEDIFASGENELLVFDNFGDSVVVLRSFQEYINTWVPVVQQFTFWETEIEDILEISINGDLAVTTFSSAGTGHAPDDSILKVRQYGTHVWKRIDGQWRIVHEHITVEKVSE